MTSYEYLHEVEFVDLRAPASRPLAELKPIFRKLGFKFHDDVVSLDRAGKIPPWQHSSVVEVEVLFEGDEVFGFDKGEWDTLRLKYLFAALPFELAEQFLKIANSISCELSIPLTLNGVNQNEIALRERFNQIREELKRDTGEEPGSELLAILINSTYPRR